MRDSRKSTAAKRCSEQRASVRFSLRRAPRPSVRAVRSRRRRPARSGTSPIGARRNRGPEGRLSQVFAVREEPQLPRTGLPRKPPALEREEPRRSGHVDARCPEVTRPPDHGATPRGDERPRGHGADSWHAHQNLVRGAGDLDREPLGMREGPRRLRVIAERQVTIRAEDQLVILEAVLPQEMLRLVEPQLARRRRRAPPLQRGAHHRLEGAEVSVVQETLPLEAGHEPEDLSVLLARRAHDELGRGTDSGQPYRRPEPSALEDETTRQL